ncbi:MAG TPA: lipopolysaccharide biosynthesis protein [Chitinophagaceae bacterium]|nr:lipopolysaccharide biosynthesis protein [Chitinophagaceae bacterium]
MEPEKQYIAPQEEEISLKDVILRLQGWWSYLLSKWLTILIVGLIGAGVGLIASLLSKPKYVGEITFVLEDSKSGSLASYASIASQFGIDLGGGSSSGIFEGDNILEFLKSRLLIERTLLSEVQTNGVKKTLAELYVEMNEMQKKWENKPKLKDLHFPLGLSRDRFTLQQDSILNIIQEKVVKKSLEIEKPDKKLSFISVKCISENEMFSKVFVEHLVNEALDFYVNTKVKRSKVNVDKLQSTADSLENLLNRKTYSLAASKDVNQNPARQMASVDMEVQARDKMVLQTMYAEVMKNLELSKMTMAQETPLVQIVDTPILPLEKEKFGKTLGVLLGGFLGGALIVIYLIGKKLYNEIMH